MTGYRFTVPNGRYRVQLEFAELAGLNEFGRIMDVFGEGQLRFNNLDVSGAVGSGGADGHLRGTGERRTARRSVLAGARRAADPNGIRVTWLSK